jgi:uncharacterized protein
MRNPDALLKQKPLFDQYVNAGIRQLSSFHFSSIFLWQDFFDFEFEVVEESLCVFAHQPKATFQYLPPLDKQHNPKVIDHCFAKMNKINPKTARIENIEKAGLGFFNNRYKAYPKSQEYLYLKQDLIDLKGHAYKSHRHDIHHFQARHQVLFRPYEEKDLHGCLSLYEQWAESRHNKHDDEIYRQMLKENRIVHELCLQYHKPLGVLGFVVEEDGKIVAYSFGYSLNKNIFCVLLEITNVRHIGLNAFIFNRVCSDEALREYTLINTMDDFGLPYVAASKQAYHPNSKPVSYSITLA